MGLHRIRINYANVWESTQNVSHLLYTAVNVKAGLSPGFAQDLEWILIRTRFKPGPSSIQDKRGNHNIHHVYSSTAVHNT